MDTLDLNFSCVSGFSTGNLQGKFTYNLASTKYAGNLFVNGFDLEIMQQYLQRIKDLEALAMAYPGVEKAYAIQAGRELRVIVEADKVTDQESDKLSFEIAQKIQTEMTFPGQIKVTVIREKRAVNVAR